MSERFTKKAALLQALIDAGDRGLTFQEIVALGLFAGRFVDTRMGELEREHHIRVDYGRRHVMAPSGKRRAFRWIYLGPRAPLAAGEPDPGPLLLPDAVGVAPGCALIGGEL